MSDELDTSGFVSEEVGAPLIEEPKAADPLAAEPVAEEPAAEDGDEPAADGAEDEGEEGEPRPKPKKTAQDRIDELTRARREAEREAAHWRKIAQGEAPQPKEEPAAQAPDPDQYEYGEADPKYISALVAHETKKGIDAARKEMAQDLHVQAQERVWETAQDAARSKYSDYDDLVTIGAAQGRWDCSPVMAQAIRSSDAGGEVAYHLASNPAEARRIASLDQISQVRELGKLEGRLAAPPAAPKPKTATDAPKPPENLARGAGGRFTVQPDTDDFAAFEAQFNSTLAN